MKKIICKKCFYRIHEPKEGDFCQIIDNDDGCAIDADRTECGCFLLKGTEPQEPCDLCGKNVFGDHGTATDGKRYHSVCYMDIEAKEREKETKKKHQELRRLFYKEYKWRIMDFAINKDLKAIADWWIEKLGE